MMPKPMKTLDLHYPMMQFLINSDREECGRYGGLMVSALDFGASGPGSSLGRGHCVVFWGKSFYSHGASLYPCVEMGTDEFNAGG